MDLEEGIYRIKVDASGHDSAYITFYLASNAVLDAFLATQVIEPIIIVVKNTLLNVYANHTPEPGAPTVLISHVSIGLSIAP